MVDGRFKKVKRDLAFRKPKATSVKTVLDDRFEPIFNDPRFSQTQKRDLTGLGLISHSEELLDPRRNLVLEVPVGERKKRKVSSPVSEPQKAPESFSDAPSEEERFHWDASSSSTDEKASESSSDDEAESEDEAEIRREAERLSKEVWTNEEDTAPRGEPSRRVAIVGLDWDNLSAIDILVMCRSAAKVIDGVDERDILKVSIYPSEFGMRRIEQEQTAGPRLEMLELMRSTENAEEVDGVIALAIRKYQKERAQYYYAIVECKSVEVCNRLYEEIDGMDADFTVDGLDLRFVPDDLVPPLPPKDMASEVPDKYQPPASFSQALRHSRAELKWDESPAKRVKLLRKKFSADELAQMDLKEYLASSSEGSVASEEGDLQSFRRTLLGDNAAAAPGVEPEEDLSASDQDDFFVPSESVTGLGARTAKVDGRTRKKRSKTFPLLSPDLRDDTSGEDSAEQRASSTAAILQDSSEEEGKRKGRSKLKKSIKRQGDIDLKQIIHNDPRFASLKGTI